MGKKKKKKKCQAGVGKNRKKMKRYDDDNIKIKKVKFVSLFSLPLLSPKYQTTSSIIDRQSGS